MLSGRSVRCCVEVRCCCVDVVWAVAPRTPIFITYGEVKQVSFVMSVRPTERGGVCPVGAPDKVGFMSSVRGWTSVSCCCLFFFFTKGKILGGRHRKRRGFYGSEEGGAGAPRDGGSKNRVGRRGARRQT